MNSLRFFIFISFLLIFISYEIFFPWRKRSHKFKEKRFRNNFLLSIINTILLKLVLPMGVYGFSLLCQKNAWGILNFLEVRETLPFIIASIILLDFFIYLQHVVTHLYNPLWRLHRVHHSDIELDISSAVRFHPLEILLSAIYKMVLIFIFGFSPFSVIAFEIILNSMAMFNHSNIKIPKQLEDLFSIFLVTPKIHVMHHSTLQKESDSNFGFNLCIWDRLFKTFTPFEKIPVIGQKKWREEKDQKIWQLLKQPLE